MKNMMIFPGQGSQFVGMGKDIYDNFKSAKDVFHQIDDALNAHLSKIIFDGSESDLTLTHNTQPALMGVSMAVLAVMQQDFNIDIHKTFHIAAGHSLGEYSAYCASGVFSLADTARLLRLRGESMQLAVPAGQGAMAAILNLSFDDIEKICIQSAQQTGGVCEIANDNSAGQVVISGHKNAIDTACILAKEAGAKRALILPVSASFHCSLMQPAADIMKDAFENITIYDAKIPVINNVNVTEITKISDIKTALISQITGRVRWRETMDYAQNHQVNHIAEIGAGKVLTGLFKRACPDIISYNLLSISEIENYAQSFIKSAA